MFGFDLLAKLIKALRAGVAPGQIAAGFALGYLIGLMPFLTLQVILLVFGLILVNVNIAAGTFGMAFTGLVVFLVDPLLHDFGFAVLTMPAVQSFWETLNNTPLAPLSRFYNTVAMGSLLVGFGTVIPVYFGAKWFVVQYREKFEERIKKWKIVRLIRGSKVYGWFEKLMKLGEV